MPHSRTLALDAADFFMPQNQPEKDLDVSKTHSFAQDQSSIDGERNDTVSPRTDPESDDEFPNLFSPPINEGEVGTFGRYRVLKLLGKGGMGAVYLAFDQRLARKVALKVMLPDAARNSKARDRFVREAKAAAQVSDDHVVSIYEADEYKGTPFIALQYLEGAPLDDYLKKKGNVSVQQAIRIGLETASGLEAAHKLGLVHRDIKPANLWLEAPKGRIKILDFGLARQAKEDVHLTQSGTIIGTPAYMSPEQARGEDVDNRTDLFSLGSVLYRLTTGEMPFKGNNTMALLTALAVDEPIPVRQLNPQVPEALAQLIHRLLSKSVEQRPNSAAEVAKYLEDIQKGGSANDKPMASKVEYVPLAVSVITEDVWAGIEQENTPQPPIEATIKMSQFEKKSSTSKAAKKQPVGLLLAVALGAILMLAGSAAIIIKITNKDGSVTELKVPDDAKVEVNGKNVTPEKTKGVAKLDPLPPWTPPEYKAIGSGPFDQLNPNAIPKEELFAWQPKELVAVIGTHARRHWGAPSSVAISPDGKWAATQQSGHPSPELIIWDLKTQKPIANLSSGPGNLSFSADGNKLFCFGFQQLRTFDLTKSPPTSDLRSNIAASFNVGWVLEDGKTLLAGNENSEIALFDLSENTAPIIDSKKISNKPLIDVLAVSDSGIIGYISPAGKLHLASVSKGKFANDLESDIPLVATDRLKTISRDGKNVAIWTNGAAGQLDIWEVKGAKSVKKHSIPSGNGSNESCLITFSPDGRWLTLTYELTSLWKIDGDQPKLITKLDEYGSGLSLANFTRDGNQLVTANTSGTVRFWDLSGASPKELSPLDYRKLYSEADSHFWPQVDPRSGRLLLQSLAGMRENAFGQHQLWDFAGATPRQILDLAAPFEALRCQFFPLAEQKWLRIPQWAGPPQRFEIRENRLQKGGDPFGEPSFFRTVSGNGKWLIQLIGTKPEDFKMVGWDISDQPVKKWSLPISTKAQVGAYWQLHSSWDGSEVALYHGDHALQKIELYRNTGPKPELTDTIPLKSGVGLYRAALSPDGHTLAHSKNDMKQLVLEDISSGKAKELHTFGMKDEQSFITWLAFSPDGDHVAFSSETSVGVFDTKTMKLIYEWKSPKGLVSWVGWAPDGRHLLMLNGNKTVYVLRLTEFIGLADRKAAEYLLSIGGRVLVEVDGKGVSNELTKLADLPKEPFKLTKIISYGSKEFTDATISRFRDCKNLKEIDIDVPITDAGLAQLPLNKNLIVFAVRSAEITDASLTRLKDCKNLRALWLISPKITEAGLANVRDCHNLNHLGLDNVGLTDVGCALFKNCKNLTFLHLTNMDLTDKGIDNFKDCKKLVELFVTKTKITATKLEEMHKSIQGCRIISEYGELKPKQ